MKTGSDRGILCWLIGTLVLAAVTAAILFANIPILIYPDLPFLLFFRRSFFILLLCCVLCMYRIARGPTPADRAVTIDIMGVLIVGFCAILGIPTGRSWYMDIGIAWALQSFIGTLALAKYLEGKKFDQ
jgi:multicomponent Na+:H+ antiporter subunit F